MDNHTAKSKIETDHQEIYTAVMAFKDGDLTFSEFMSFCKSFNPDVTVDEVINALETC
jgi:hypothetical protein